MHAEDATKPHRNPLSVTSPVLAVLAPLDFDPLPQFCNEITASVNRCITANFYFGCEADDPMNAAAFNTQVNPFGAKLKAVFSSDIGHWNVPDMTEVVEEAYELVEHGTIDERDLHDFMFVNPARLRTDMNPNFFK